MRYAWKALLIIALLAAGAVVPAVAGTQKVIFDDEFGWAT